MRHDECFPAQRWLENRTLVRFASLFNYALGREHGVRARRYNDLLYIKVNRFCCPSRKL
jgi:hypothetical protein